jgi:phosphoserine phosphatase RsbU/P
MISKERLPDQEVKNLKSAIEELTVLNELAIAAGSSLEVDQVLDTIVQKSIKAMKAEQGSILLVTEQQDTPFKTFIRQADLSGVQSYRVGTHITGWVLKNQQPLIIENLSTDQRFKTTPAEQRAIQTVLCVPIWSKAKIMGILMVTNKKTGEPFSKDDARLLSIIAAQSGQLIRNSQLQQEAIEKKRLSHELDLARKMQLDILPKSIPKIPGLDIARFFQPADSVSGDYYDFYLLPDNRLLILLADVSGHGPSAALMMTMLKGVFHSIIKNYSNTAQILNLMNNILNDILPEEIFVTCQLFEIDTTNRTAILANAGHHPLIIFRGAVGSCEQVELKSCALNILDNFDYQMKDIKLESNDVLVLYTDGLNEAINGDGEMFGLARIINTINDAFSDKADLIIKNIKENLDSFTGSVNYQDDLAIIVIKII